jgi:hypothetical protein
MKKQIFMSAFALVLLIPAFSFKNIDHPQHVNRAATAKQSIVELGDFTRDGNLLCNGMCQQQKSTHNGE